jgi:hypothetical protein
MAALYYYEKVCCPLACSAIMRLKTCPGCGTQVGQQDSRCWHCRLNFPSTPPKKSYKWVAWWFLGLVPVGLVLWPHQPKDVPLNMVKRPPDADLQNPSREAKPVPEPARPEQASLEMLSSKSEYRDGVTAIVGQVRNNTGKTYRYVSINFSLYDKSGAQVGTALAGISGLNAYGTWKFRAFVTEKDAYRFDLQSLSGF